MRWFDDGLASHKMHSGTVRCLKSDARVDVIVCEALNDAMVDW